MLQFVEKLARHLKECLRDGAFENVRILVSKVFADIYVCS